MIEDVDNARLRPGLRGRSRNLRACVDCGRPCVGSRCSTHQAARDAAKAARPERAGYGADHRRLRAELDPVVMAGHTRCAAGPDCKRAVDGVADFIRTGEPWHLGHAGDRTWYLGPMHEACNCATARKAA